MDFSVKALPRILAEEAKDAVVNVYRSVYSLPPYNEPESRILSFATSWTDRTKKPGFIFVGAKDSESNLIGMAYGWRSTPGDSWHKKLSEAWGEKGQFGFPTILNFMISRSCPLLKD